MTLQLPPMSPRLRKWIEWRENPSLMMKDAGFEPDPHQIELLECNDPNVLVRWPRQSGKSRTCAVKVLHEACFFPGDVVILAGEKEAQALEIYEKAYAMHGVLSEIGELPPVERSNNVLKFGNGSRVLALPSTVESIRGYAARLVLIDEAAFTPEGTLAKVSPMLSATNGRLICPSTPNGARGWFWEAWHNGEGWRRLTVSIDQLPRLSAAEIQRQRNILTPMQFRQEYLLEWLDGDQQFFPHEVIEAALDDSIEPLFDCNGSEVLETADPIPVEHAGLIEEERTFQVGIDVGMVSDPTTVAVIQRVRMVPTARALQRGRHREARAAAGNYPERLRLRYLARLPLGTLYPRQVEILSELLTHRALRGAEVYLDATGVGKPVLQMLKRAGVRNLHGVSITSAQSEARRVPDGWNVGKAELVNGVTVAMQTARLRLGRRVDHVDLLVKELRDFRAKQNANTGNMTFNAREGQHDDLVLAVSYAVFGASRPTPATSIDMRLVA